MHSEASLARESDLRNDIFIFIKCGHGTSEEIGYPQVSDTHRSQKEREREGITKLRSEYGNLTYHVTGNMRIRQRGILLACGGK